LEASISEVSSPCRRDKRQSKTTSARPADDPEVTLRGATAFFVRVVAAHRRFIGLKIIAGEEPPMHLPVDGLQPGRGHLDPVAHGAAADRGTQRDDICSKRYSGR